MADFISGRHLKSRVYFDGQPWNLKVKSVRVEEMATEVTDQVNGEERARFQKITDGFRVTIQVYEDGGSQLLQNFLTNQANEDAIAPQLALSAGLLFEYLDTTKGGFVFKNCTLDPLEMDATGRTERIMTTIKFRAQYFEQVPSA